MQHQSCKDAIRTMLKDNTVANVYDTETKITCPHKPTPCDWSGNTRHFACLLEEHIHPQNVYDTLNAGGHGKIILDTGKTQK